MSGLKSYLTTLAGYLNTTPDALYERQRKLTSAGLLVGAEGRGPGSGIRVAPPALTWVVLAVMATDNLGDVVASVEMLASKASDTRRCALTGASTFSSAVELILASEAVASTVTHIKVRRSTLEGEIMWSPKRRNSREFSFSTFGRKRGAARRGLEAELTLPGETVQALAKDLAALVIGKRIDAGEQK